MTQSKKDVIKNGTVDEAIEAVFAPEKSQAERDRRALLDALGLGGLSQAEQEAALGQTVVILNEAGKGQEFSPEAAAKAASPAPATNLNDMAGVTLAAMPSGARTVFDKAAEERGVRAEDMLLAAALSPGTPKPDRAAAPAPDAPKKGGKNRSFVQCVKDLFKALLKKIFKQKGKKQSQTRTL